MKAIIKFIYVVFAASLVLTACSPDDDHSLGTYDINADQISFALTPGSNEWTYNYAVSYNSEIDTPHSCEVNFGDGVTTKNLAGTHEYVVAKGTYTAQCVVYTPDGNMIVKEVTVTINNDNPGIFTDNVTSLQYALTGGKANTVGKTWYIGEWTAMRNPNDRADIWWDYNGPEPAMMNDVMIFTPNSINPNGGYKYENNGDTFANEAAAGAFADGDASGSFVSTTYTPPTDATWEITQDGDKTILTITKGFLSYAITAGDLVKTEYEVLSYSPTSIKLSAVSTSQWCFELVSTPEESPLTGTGSKTWVIDGYNKHTADAIAECGLNIEGFMGLGPLNSNSQEWWGAGAGEKSFEKVGWTLYDWKITFTSLGQLNIETAGQGYGRKAFDGQGFSSTFVDGDDMTFNYDGGDYTYTLDEAATPYPKLTLSGNAFLGYYCGTQEYEVVALTDNVLAVVVHNTVEEQDWVLVFTPDGQQ
jgi:hypothetical protein